MVFRTQVLVLIALASLVRIAIAANTELGNDEVYYWTYAIQPDWSHFDHPPLVGLFIRFFTFNLNFHNELFLRLPAIIAAAANTWIIYLAGTKIKNELAGFYAALLYTSSVYTSIIAGLFILPDSPELFFWVLSVYLMLNIFFYQTVKRNKMLWLGVCIGLATMCKVHGMYLWMGAGAYILLFDRKWLMYWQLYASVLITLIIIFPILWWNIQNHFITYNFHEGRLLGRVFSITDIFRELAGEIAYNNPVNYGLYVLALVAVFRKQPILDRKLKALLLLLSLPLIFTVWFIAAFNKTFPHWSGPGFISLMLLTSAVIAEMQWKRAIGVLRISLVLILVFIAAGWTAIHFLPFTFGKKSAPDLGKGDVTLDMYGWKQFEQKFATIYREDIKTSRMQAGSFIISEKWFPASHLDFYVARPLDITLLAIGPLADIHKYAWLNHDRRPLKTGDDAYFISPSNLFSDPNAYYGNNFSYIGPPLAVPVYRMGKVVRIFYVYRMKNCINTQWDGSWEWRLNNPGI